MDVWGYDRNRAWKIDNLLEGSNIYIFVFCIINFFCSRFIVLTVCNHESGTVERTGLGKGKGEQT